MCMTTGGAVVDHLLIAGDMICPTVVADCIKGTSLHILRSAPLLQSSLGQPSLAPVGC